MYSCLRQSFYRQLGVPPTNPNTRRLGAIMGTAIHNGVEDAFLALVKRSDQDEQRFWLEHEFPGIEGLIGPAHVDLFDTYRQRVVDWKTSTLKNRRYFPKDSQIGQVQIYGYLAHKAGYTVKTVELVSIARDGDEEDLVSHVEPYDEGKALDALQWFHELAEYVKNGEVPPCGCPSLEFARRYSSYYGPSVNDCQGRSR